MPSSSHKMMAEWIDPYKVLRKVNEYNYEIQLPKRKTILHINMLKNTKNVVKQWLRFW